MLFRSTSSPSRGSSDGELCQRAAEQIAQCSGMKPTGRVTSCDRAQAQAILSQGCAGRASSWNNAVCSYGFELACGEPVDVNEACGLIDEHGRCDGDVLSYCVKGTVQTKTCPPGTCARITGGYAACSQPSACGAVTPKGVCEGVDRKSVV